MYDQVEGALDTRTGCSFEYTEPYINDGEYTKIEPRLNLIKDGNVCWYVTKSDLVFDYLTKDLK